MKISVSLPHDDVRFLDKFAEEHGLASRSTALHRAVGVLRAADLSASYEEAFAS